MQHRYQLSIEAEADVFESYVWYENQKYGLGEAFLSALDLAKESILANPNTYKVVYKRKVRVYHVLDFPFSIFYMVDDKEVNVLAVFHTSRNPKTLKKRV